jgi:hypothetical protein
MITKVVVEYDHNLPKKERKERNYERNYGEEPVQDLEGTVTRAVAQALRDDEVERVIIERDLSTR